MSASQVLVPSLETLLTNAAPRLTATVLAEMFANPFWHERFGDRGREHGGRDGDSHVRYLVQALAADDPRVFLAYAVWLREVLVSRGMCSRHLVENFERLANAIERESWAEGERATAILRAGAQALVHTRIDAAAIDAVRASVAREAVALLYAKHPEWLLRSGETGRTRCIDDLEYHLSYLADALAFSQRERFVEYVAFLAEFLERRGVPAEHLRESLLTLSESLRTALPALTEAPFQCLAAGGAFDAAPAPPI